MKHYHINKKDSLPEGSGSFLFPGEIAAGENTAENIMSSEQMMKKKVFFIADRFVTREYGAYICGGSGARYIEFSGSIDPGEFNRLKNAAKDGNVIISAGGGKCIDICKLIKRDIPEIMHIAVPTSAAACSACSAVSVMYDRNGVYMKTLDAPLPDKTVIDHVFFDKLPKAFFSAGAVDTIAKYYETRAYKKFFPGRADPCAEGAFSAAEKAKEMLENIFLKEGGIKTAEKRQLAEINIVLSGIISAMSRFYPTSFIAHHLAHSFSAAANTKGFLHGELVGAALLIQEKYTGDEAAHNEIERLLAAADMPVSLRKLGIREEDMDAVFEKFGRLCRTEKLGVSIEKNLMYNVFISKY
ncbi:MAG: iron-containing alcohol dehydrogenase [Candidatus Goldiibacteriota bacterium]